MKRILFFLITCSIVLICNINALQLTPVSATTTEATTKYEPITSNEISLHQHDSQSYKDAPKKNKEDRIVLSDPVKTLLKTTTRLAVDLSPLPRFVSTDTVMSYIERIVWKLSKTAVLIVAIKVTAFAASAISVIMFWFPGTINAVTDTLRVQQQRLNELEQFWRTSMHPDAIVDRLARTSDEAMDRLGFQDRSCRERSVCEIGDILSCSFPSFISQAKEFAANSLPEIDVSRNRYSRALVAGLNRTDCAGKYEVPSSTCSSLLEWINSTVWGNSSVKKTDS